MSDPLVVQVNGADGNPVAGALVSFRCEGIIFNPPAALSDSSGQVSVALQLGSIPGGYQVAAETPKSGGGTVTLTSREIALGYQEKLGKEVSEKYCTVCHDPESTPERVSNFDNLAPPAPHLFTDGSTLNPMSDADLIKIIADGGPALGKSPQTPAYRSTLTSAEIKAVVAYLRAGRRPPLPYFHEQIGDQARWLHRFADCQSRNSIAMRACPSSRRCRRSSIASARCVS